MRPFEASVQTKNSWLACFALLHILGLSGYMVHLVTGWSLDRLLVEPFQLYDIYWSGVYLIIAFVIGYGVAFSLPFPSWDQKQHKIFHRPLTILLLGLFGARLFDIFYLSPISLSQGIGSSSDYFSNPILIFDLNWGGLNIWGAIVFVTVWICWRSWWKNGSLTPIFLKAVIGLLAGSSLIQWGNFLSQQFYGQPYRGIGAIYIDVAYRLPDYLEFEQYFPLFFVGAIWYLIGVLFLIFGRRWSKNNAQVDRLLVGLSWFAVGRLGLELATQNSSVNALPGLVLIVVVCMVGIRHQYQKRAL